MECNGKTFKTVLLYQACVAYYNRGILFYIRNMLDFFFKYNKFELNASKNESILKYFYVRSGLTLNGHRSTMLFQKQICHSMGNLIW